MPNTWRAILATSNVSSSRILQASIWYLGSTFSCTWVAHQVVITTVGLLHPRQRSNSSTPSSPSFFSSSSSPSWSHSLTHCRSQILTPQAPLPITTKLHWCQIVRAGDLCSGRRKPVAVTESHALPSSTELPLSYTSTCHSLALWPVTFCISVFVLWYLYFFLYFVISVFPLSCFVLYIFFLFPSSTWRWV